MDHRMYIECVYINVHTDASYPENENRGNSKEMQNT